MLLGVLNESASVYGESRAIITIPPLVLLLVGGVWADRINTRTLLLSLTGLLTLVPIGFYLALDYLSVWLLISFGTVIALLNALGDPGRQALVNRVTRIDIQRSIVIVTVIPNLVAFGVFEIGKELETIGLGAMLWVLTGIFALGALAVAALPNVPPIRTERQSLREGLRAMAAVPVVRNAIGMNFVSAIFNAGGYMVAMPLITMRVLGGDSELLAFTMQAFLVGSTGSTLLMYFFMPLRFPGRVYTLLQLTRVLIIIGFLVQPSEYVFICLIGLWGANMGITSTLVRTTVQELAPAAHRAKILGFFLFSFMLASPISAFLLGHIIEFAESQTFLTNMLPGPIWGLVLGIPISIALFYFGWRHSGLWEYELDTTRSPT